VFLSIYVNAQNIAISIDVTGHDERTVIDYSGMKCATEGATAVYKIIVEGCDSIEEVPVCKYFINNVEYEASYSLEKGILSINDITPSLIVGVNELSFILSLKEKGKAELTELSSTAMNIQIYPVPTHQMVTAPSDFMFCNETGELVWSASGDGGAKWEYSWTSTEGISGNSAFFKHPSIVNNGTIEKDVTVMLKATNYAPDGITVWDTYSDSWNVKVWPKASVTLSDDSNSSTTPKLFFQDGKWNLSVRSSGGYKTGWKYMWKDEEGNVLGKNETYAITCDKVSDEVQEKHIVLTVTNEPQDGADLWFNQTFDFYAKFYPAPIVELEKNYPPNIKHGDKVSLSLSVLDSKGNNLGDAYDLNYLWNDGQSKNDIFEYVGENPNNYDGVKITIRVSCTVKLKGTNLEQPYTRQADIMVWPVPMVDITGLSDRVGYGGQIMEFSVAANGGKKDGWSYVWTQNNQQLSVSSNICNMIIDDAPEEGSINNCNVRVTNICDGQLWFDEVYPFHVTMYSKPRVPESVVLVDKNRGAEVSSGVREGNDLILHCDECTGGYPGGWSYKWLRNDEVLGTWKELNEQVPMRYSGSGKANDLQIEYSCYVENLYNTIPWIQQDYKKNIRVYRKPLTPTSLQKKGNGTSGTLIATCEIDDASLGLNDYYLVFGYRDVNGEMHDVSSVSQQNIGEQRWSSLMSSSGYNDGSNNAYVYALWKYNDGAEITSGLCLESHIEEDWDGSTYNGVTRSVIADVTSIKGNLSTSAGSNECEYYTINGQKSNHIMKGLNIIRRNDGQFVKYVYNSK
jgi:hypothetical protein